MVTSDAAHSTHLPRGGPERQPVDIVPLTVVAQTFPARPSALPEVRDFVRRQLTGTSADDDVRILCDRVAQVLLDAAGVATSIEVSLRVSPAATEVDVLFTENLDGPQRRTPVHSSADRAADASAGRHDLVAGRYVETARRSDGGARLRDGAASQGDATATDGHEPGPPAAGPPPSFALWLAGRLRREGLTLQAAARRLDVSAKTVSRWVAGTTEPRLRDLYHIREVFGEPPIH